MEDQQQQQQRQSAEGLDDEKPSIYRPDEGATILLDYRSAPRLKYRDRTHEEMQGAVHSPYIKSLICDVAFLTGRAMQGDMVVYVGNNVGPWIATVAKMFPTLHFLVYDGNSTKLSKVPSEAIPENLHIRKCWFNQQEALKIKNNMKSPVLGNLYNPASLLLMAETNNLIWDKDTNAGPVEKDLNKDLNDQDNWLHSLRPRSALLKFCLPYKGAKNYSYLKGQIMLQPFAHKNSTEVKLVVDSPTSSSSMYDRDLYDADVHDECMFYHNSITRLMHVSSDSKIKVSWDQHMCHQVLETWTARALEDEQISGVGTGLNIASGLMSKKAVADARSRFVKDMLNEVDLQFGRTLGCRMSPTLSAYVDPDNHLKRKNRKNVAKTENVDVGGI